MAKLDTGKEALILLTILCELLATDAPREKFTELRTWAVKALNDARQ